jgi:porphobilinogen synthase
VSGYPQVRLRRLRRTAAMRRLFSETSLSVNDLVLPLFVIHGSGVKNKVKSMPGVFQYSVDMLPREVEKIAKLGINAVLLFGIPEDKDEVGSSSCRSDSVVQQAIRVIKETVPDMLVITDVCLCEYTSHGHCGVIVDGDVDNDKTLELLARMALSHAEAGADIIAPSDMMDGRVKAIRETLDDSGFVNLPIMSYAVKYASAFYGPFRDAAQSAPQFGDRRSYQMNPANVREALREAEQDVAEGADILMVKPALAYLDVISKVRAKFDLPIAAYNVSGEYSMIKAAAARGWIDERRAVMEMLTSIKRAGADVIMTYHAKDVARWLREV